ncbi:hypothetical protein D3C85_1238270 [compost metagenome]
MTTTKSIVLNGYLTSPKFQMGLSIAKVTAFDHRINVIFQIIFPWIAGVWVFIDSFEQYGHRTCDVNRSPPNGHIFKCRSL